MSSYIWHPINDLPRNWREFLDADLSVLALSWSERSQQLKASQKLKEFNERLSRQWAIETGIIERIYTLDRGITQLLIEKGIEASLIPHDATDQPTGLVVSIIRDQKEVIDGLFDFVAQRRQLSNSYIKQMHQVFTRNQKTTEGLDTFGRLVDVEILRGDWKKWPNNPRRPDGETHEYCPPEQVASEMDRLIEMHLVHENSGVSPEIEAAWLHHRFTQIHPFQDGNGRVARALASLIFLRAGWFPLVITNEFREDYIFALEQADNTDLKPLISLISKRQISAFRQALSLSEDIPTEMSIQVIIKQSLERLRQRKTPSRVFDISTHVEMYTQSRLEEIAKELSTSLKTIEPDYWASVKISEPDETDYWFKGQIIQTAQFLEYFANTRVYRAWVQLKIKEERHANLLFSFHGLGYEFSGIMAVSAFLEFREESENGENIAEKPCVVCENIFQFSYKDDQMQVLERFKPWLEETILIGLEQWRKQL